MRFYRDTLGLRVTDWVFVKTVGLKIAFLHCNQRHHDRTFSFYFRNPGSWHFELGWGSRIIDPDNCQVQYYDGMRPRGGEWGHDGMINVI